MLEDKAIIIIAVSKYAGAYKNLPGAITSARRLRKWAEQPGEDCNYNVLYLADYDDDDKYKKIDVQLLSTEVENFVENNLIDRLVVYFAGHGIVRSLGQQFWLLTDAADNIMEGINVEAFRSGLLKCNIGNADFVGQLCIIGDACRNTGKAALDFYGHPILTKQGKKNPDIELDRFLSTGLGDYSVHVNETGSQRAYCLFSEMMLSALRGEVKEAIETQNHQFQPAVTNHKLASYLRKEVRKRAAVFEENMEPDILPTISPPYNFYKKLTQPLSSVVSRPQDPQLTAAIRMTIRDPQKEGNNNEPLTELQERRKQTLIQLKQSITLKNIRSSTLRFNSTLDPNNPNFSTISDFRPKYVAAPNRAGTTVNVVRQEKGTTFYEIVAANCYDSPILILQEEQWILTPNYPNVFTVISQNLPGDILFLKTGYAIEEPWDTYLSDFSNLVGNIPLRAADARKFADKIRVGKEEYPHQAVTAGYLYEFSNDYDNIARTAHYMARNTGTVPFDLALLCADKIWWSQKNGRLVAFADLPAVEQSQTIDNEEYRPYYARSEFEACQDVRLWGIAPIFGYGWSFMQTELYLEIPEEIRLIGKNMNGRSAASFTDQGYKMFIEAFDYRLIETDT